MENGIPDLEEILRGKGGVQSIVNSKMQKSDYRQTVSWEAYLSRYIRFQKHETRKESEDETDGCDVSNIQSLKQKYHFLVIPDDETFENE